MNREETKRAVEVMQAWLDGQQIEYRHRYDYDNTWYPADDDDLWAFHRKDYRVKPKPREFWVCPRREKCLDYEPIGVDFIRVREVLDDE